MRMVCTPSTVGAHSAPEAGYSHERYPARSLRSIRCIHSPHIRATPYLGPYLSTHLAAARGVRSAKGVWVRRP